MAVDDAQQPLGVLGDRDDLDPALAHERHQPLAQQRVVLGDHDPHGSSTRIAVPTPGSLATVELAVERLGAVAQAGQPAARRVGAAWPVVGDLHDQPPVALDEVHRGARARRVLGDVGQRLGDDEVGGGLDHRQRALGSSASTLTGTAERRRAPRRPPRGRGRRARAGRSRGRGRAARRSRRPPRPRAPHQVGLLRAVGEPLLGAPELHRQRDQPRLRAVVEVALDPPQLGGLHLDARRAACGSARRRARSAPARARRPTAGRGRRRGRGSPSPSP